MDWPISYSMFFILCPICPSFTVYQNHLYLIFPYPFFGCSLFILSKSLFLILISPSIGFFVCYTFQVFFPMNKIQAPCSQASWSSVSTGQPTKFLWFLPIGPPASKCADIVVPHQRALLSTNYIAPRDGTLMQKVWVLKNSHEKLKMSRCWGCCLLRMLLLHYTAAFQGQDGLWHLPCWRVLKILQLRQLQGWWFVAEN